MFMHRNCGRHARAVSLGILTATLISTARAAQAPAPFVFVAYSNRTGGEGLISGDYGSAVQAVQQSTHAAPPDPQALDTNRCIAYAMTQQLSQAHVACDAAVREAQADDTSVMSAWSAQARQRSAACAAAAYSNRAVLHWLDADRAAAQADLAKAQALAPQASFVVRNLNAMRAHQTVGSQTAATAQGTAAQE